MALQSSGMIYQAVSNEEMTILTKSATSTDTPAEQFTKLENTVVLALASHLSANDILNAADVDPIKYPKIAEIVDNFEITEITEEERETFSIETTTDITDISMAFLTTYATTALTNLDAYSFNIGTSNTPVIKDVSIDNLNSIYSSHISAVFSNNSSTIKSTALSGGSALPINIEGDFSEDSEDTGVGPWTAAFDSTNSNVNYLKAVNSEYNNCEVTEVVVDEVTEVSVDYQRPMKVAEYATFNSENALGMDLLASDHIQYYYTLDTDGKPTPVEIPATGASSSTGSVSESYRLHDNGISAVKSEGFSTIAQSDLGSYRVQYYPEGPAITKTADTDITKFPVSNGSTSLPLNTLNIDQIRTMFDSSEVIIGGYEYSITITEDADSGYSVSSTTLLEQDTEEEPIFSLDSSSLKDNLIYMENYVNGSHTLTFNNSTLEIESVGAASTSNLDLFSLDGRREYLQNSNDGQIKINTRTPLTRHNVVSGDLAVTPSVYYNTEGGSLAGISNDLKTNNYVAFLDQLVMQNTADVEDYFMKHNSVTLDLFNASSIVNSNFNTSDFEFTATNKTTGVAAEVIRINPSKQLASVNGFSKSDSSSVSGIFAFATLSNLKTTLIGDSNVFDKAQMLFNLKPLVGSKIKTSATTAGWSLVTSDSNGNMVSSSSSAFASDNTQFPSLDLTKSLISGVTTGIDFNISVLTDTSGDATQVEQLRDEVKIEYWVTGTTGDKKELIIPQELLTKTQVGSDPAPVIGSAIRISSGDLSSKLSGKTIDVYPVTAVKNYKYACELPLRGFTGLTMTTPTITSTTTYHIIKDSITLEQLPSSFHQYVKGGFYKNISEAFSAVSSISGTFDKTDLCDMSMKVVSKDTDDNETPTVADRDLTSLVSVSMYYGIDVKTNLNDADKDGVSSVDGDITLRCECDYSNQSNAEAVVTLNDNAGYLLNLTNRYDTNFSCDYWSATLANITTNTSIASTKNTTDYTTGDKKLSIQNGYSSITTWNSTSHKVVVTYADNKATTILSIQNATTDVELYQIKTKNSTYLNTQAVLSNVVKDVHRVDSWLGTGPNSVTDDGFVENFIQVDYTGNVYQIYTGVYFSVSAPATGKTSPFTLLTNNGKYTKITLKSDQVGANLIGSVSTLSDAGSNNSTFQYVSDNFSSQILTIDSQYRGFFGPLPNDSEVVQVYTISRPTMTATLTIQRSTTDATFPSSISQTWEVYAGDSADTVTSLSGSVSGSSVSIGDMGLNITFHPSMLASSDSTSFTIYPRGDAVTLSVLNPNAPSGSYRLPLSSSTTLKTFILDTFGGLNFNNTGKTLGLNSRRLKLRSNNSSNTFDISTVFWKLKINVSRVGFYKNDNYLGNPINIDTNDAYLEPDSEVWADITPESINTNSNFYDFIGDGITINGWTFTMDNSVTRLGSVSYFTIAPPYYEFSMIQTVSKTLPCPDSTTGLRTVYLPVSSTNVYNPFTETKTYTYSDTTTTVTVTNDVETDANDVTFTKSGTDSSLASFTTSSSTFHFVIEGTNVDIKLFPELKAVTGTTSIMTLFNAPVNRAMYLSKLTSPYIIFMDSLTDSNSGIKIKILQPENATVPDSDLTSEDIFASQILDFNVELSIQNLFILPNSSIAIPVTPPVDPPVTFVTPSNTLLFDLPTNSGNQVFVYTRETSTNSNGDHIITIYKYNSLNNITTSPSTVYSGTYLTRQSKQIVIPRGTFLEYISTKTILTNSRENFTKEHVNKNTVITGLNTQSWSTSSTFGSENGTFSSVYFSILTPSESSKSTIPAKFFDVDLITTSSRAVFFTKGPILTSFDNLGFIRFQITGHGTVKTPSVHTTSVNLTQANNTAVFNDTRGLANKTTMSFKTNNIGIA